MFHLTLNDMSPMQLERITEERMQIQRQKKNICPSEISFSEVDVQISCESEKIMLFSHLLKKMAPIYPETDELWRAENWPKLVSSLVSSLYVSCCYSSAVITGFPEH